MSTDTETGMVYFCCDRRRRADVRRHAMLNGIDFLEVVDHDAVVAADRQRVLRVHLLKPLVRPPGEDLTRDNIEFTGGVRTTGIRATSVTPGADLVPGDTIVIRVDERGDFSTYTLRLVETTGAPLAGFDPLLTAIDFSFKVECPSDFDCRDASPCSIAPLDEPEIDYLSRDFNSLRQMMLDRMSVIIPEWRERSLADLGITLVELLAYIGDYLSYQQDAIATEAYLGTARRRISVRRHARLVDYFMSDGCNARVWVQVRVTTSHLKLGRGTMLLTGVPGFPGRIIPGSSDLERLLSLRPEVFETMHDVELRAGYERMRFYTWGDRECCIPGGAVRAALAGEWEHLKQGDVLVFQEELGPRTGRPEDADRTRRHAVRLSAPPVHVTDPLHDDPADPMKMQHVTLIEWDAGDALPFPFCVSAITDRGEAAADVSVALGNIVLADHGRTIRDEEIGAPPDADPRLAAAGGDGHCGDRRRTPPRPRFRPRLKHAPLTIAGTVARTAVGGGRRRRLAFDPDAPAADAFHWDMERVAPAISIVDGDGGLWLPQRDLLASDPFASEFVAEMEEDGRAALRFGDGEYGRVPAPGVVMNATYRVGSGTRGNIGAASLAHIVSFDSGVTSIYNPLPARGGTEPESLEHVRQNAPTAFFRQERGVTADDYAEVTGRHRQVQRAAATFRWTGSWRTVFVTVDRLGGGRVDAAFEEAIATHLERYRMAGHDLEIDGPRPVSLELEMKVCVAPGYFRSDVKRALLEAFSNRSFADGRRGFFHPDDLTFAQPVYLSRLYAVAQSVAGVGSVEITAFRRLDGRGDDTLKSGVLEIGRLEIARLDNDPNIPENGMIRLAMGGGR